LHQACISGWFIVVTVGTHSLFWSAPLPHYQPDANVPADQDGQWLGVRAGEEPLLLAGMG
jgi:hypothetical protein